MFHNDIVTEKFNVKIRPIKGIVSPFWVKTNSNWIHKERAKHKNVFKIILKNVSPRKLYFCIRVEN